MEDTFFKPYDADFYRQHQSRTHHTAYRAMARSLAANLRFKSVVDVGCGLGNLLSELVWAKGGIVYLGIEAPQVRGEILKAGPAIDPRQYLWKDLRSVSEFRLPSFYDLCISVEVAEHLPSESAPGYVRFLTSLSDTVFFSGAKPGQGGTAHINEQPGPYWDRMFQANDFKLDPWTTEQVVTGYEKELGVLSYYANALVYRRKR